MRREDLDDDEIPLLPNPKSGSGTLTVLKPQSPKSVEETLLSSNLVNDSGNHLLELMVNLNAKNADDVRAACECAKQIAALAHLKLKVYRTIRGLD